MLSFRPITDANNAASYYSNTDVNDFYDVGDDSHGQYCGRLQDKLFLYGQAKSGDLVKILQGFHPATGESLSSNAGPKHKPGYDFTFSAPKSTSLAWSLSEPDHRIAIQLAQINAVEAGFNFLQDHAFLNRDRNLGSAQVRELIAIQYDHYTNRDHDPHLHTHLIVVNLSRRTDQSFCAIDFDSRWKHAAGAMYRAELAYRLRLLGYSIESDKGSFAITGIDPALCNLFSKRRNALVEQAKIFGASTPKVLQISAFVTRQPKGEPLSSAILLDRWKNEVKANGLMFDATHLNNRAKTIKTEMATHAEIFEAITNQLSTFTLMQLYECVAISAQEHLSALEIEEYMRELLVNPTLVKLHYFSNRQSRVLDSTNVRFTTQPQLALEQALVDRAKARSDEAQHQIDITQFKTKYRTLTDEQFNALLHIVNEVGSVKLLLGLAGTGKGYLLRTANEIWRTAGLNVVGAALAAKAADGLFKSSDIPSETIHSLLSQLDKGNKTLSASTIVVVDEAGMAGSRQLAKLLNYVHAAEAKAVLVGDCRQLQPIDSGGAFRLLSQHLGYASLKQIQRQSYEIDRKIVELFADGQSDQALLLMRSQGNLVINSTHNSAVRKLVDDWWELTANSKQNTLMIAGTQSDARQLNYLARLKMNAAGLLGKNCAVESNLNNRPILLEFAAGDRILFCKNHRKLGICNGDSGTLSDLKFRLKGSFFEFTVELDNGTSVCFAVTDDERFNNRYRNIDHAYAITVHKAQGATVDHAFVFVSDQMTDREWTYVASSRARQQTKFYCTSEVAQQLEKLTHRSRQKDTSLDYYIIPASKYQIERLG